MVVTVTSYSREPDISDGTGRRQLKREYHLTLNWPAAPLGPDASDAIDTALRAADRTGMLHDSIHALDVRVEWDGIE
jgi:hypothetical protein